MLLVIGVISSALMPGMLCRIEARTGDMERCRRDDHGGSVSHNH